MIVDDDMRNIFALSSALENYEMMVEIATNGQEAIKKLEEIADIDIRHARILNAAFAKEPGRPFEDAIVIPVHLFLRNSHAALLEMM